ncbi:hypothetical protein KAR02_05795 [Candidatus Bipolaricaulota bacterium]|nr:hypothetical protein [Candidatus Bipolaricaulota bacterium]
MTASLRALCEFSNLALNPAIGRLLTVDAVSLPTDTAEIAAALGSWLDDLDGNTERPDWLDPIRDGMEWYASQTGVDWFDSVHATEFVRTELPRVAQIVRSLVGNRQVFFGDIHEVNRVLRCFSMEALVPLSQLARGTRLGRKRVPLGSAIPPTLYASAPESRRLFFGIHIGKDAAEEALLDNVLRGRLPELVSRKGRALLIFDASGTTWWDLFREDPWRRSYIQYPPRNLFHSLQEAWRRKHKTEKKPSYDDLASLVSGAASSPSFSAQEVGRLARGQIAPLLSCRWGLLKAVTAVLQDPKSKVMADPGDVWKALADTAAGLQAPESMVVVDEGNVLLEYCLYVSKFRFKLLEAAPHIYPDRVYSYIQSKIAARRCPPMGDYGCSEAYSLCYVLYREIGRMLETLPRVLICDLETCRKIFIPDKRAPKNTRFCSDTCRSASHNAKKKIRES